MAIFGMHLPSLTVIAIFFEYVYLWTCQVIGAERDQSAALPKRVALLTGPVATDGDNRGLYGTKTHWQRHF